MLIKQLFSLWNDSFMSNSGHSGIGSGDISETEIGDCCRCFYRSAESHISNSDDKFWVFTVDFRYLAVFLTVLGAVIILYKFLSQRKQLDLVRRTGRSDVIYKNRKISYIRVRTSDLVNPDPEASKYEVPKNRSANRFRIDSNSDEDDC